MKRLLVIFFFLTAFWKPAQAQLALYNSRTLYDAFENPSQKAFYTDSSKQFAFNFLVPTLSLNSAVSGSGVSAIKAMLVDGLIDSRQIPINQNKYTHLAVHTNIYLLSFRWFKQVKYQQKMGFSWQLRNDTRARVSNETLAIFDDAERFPSDTYSNIFNNQLEQQTFHQFAFTYRENYNKRIAFGAKLSFLSGIAYSGGKINYSRLDIDRVLNTFELGYTANIKSSIKKNEDAKELLLPGFKNPGIAFTASANFKFKKGWFLMANIKDLGFIRWRKNPQVYTFTEYYSINQADAPDADDRLYDQIGESFVAGNSSRNAFSTKLNSKIEVLLNRNFGVYQPNLLLSKNIWYAGGNFTLINNILIKNHILSLSPSYNFLNYTDLGFQYMYKTPNYEFFIGNDQLFKTVQLVKGLGQSDAALLTGHVGAGFYLGFAAKFGKLMEHPLNATFIPGLEPAGKKKDESSFFRKLFGKKNSL